MAGILFVLRRMHTGVVGNSYHHTGVNPGVGSREQRVRRNIQADVFHTAERPRTGYRRTCGNFHSDLFVRRPFAVNIVIFRDALRNFRTRRAGIARSHPQTRFIKTTGDRLVTDQQLFTHLFTSKIIDFSNPQCVLLCRQNAQSCSAPQC